MLPQLGTGVVVLYGPALECAPAPLPMPVPGALMLVGCVCSGIVGFDSFPVCTWWAERMKREPKSSEEFA